MLLITFQVNINIKILLLTVFLNIREILTHVTVINNSIKELKNEKNTVFCIFTNYCQCY